MAEYKNYQNRTTRDREKSVTIALKSIMLDVLRNLDHLEMAVQSAEKDNDVESLCNGIRMTETEMRKSLEKYGLERINTEDEYFDPDYHEAVLQEETSEYADEKVMQEFKPGYTLKGMVLRPSMVKVARNPDQPMPEEVKRERREAKNKTASPGDKKNTEEQDKSEDRDRD